MYVTNTHTRRKIPNDLSEKWNAKYIQNQIRQTTFTQDNTIHYDIDETGTLSSEWT